MTVPSIIDHSPYRLTENLVAVPYEPGVLAYAQALRRVVASYKPEVILVEYPAALSDEIFDLARDLPLIQILAWRAHGGGAYMIPADPCDARMEAVRIGIEYDIPVHCIDVLDRRGLHVAPELPDGLLVEQLGAGAFTRAVEAGLYGENQERPPMDRADRVMAARLGKLSRDGVRVLHVGAVWRIPRLRHLLTTECALEDEAVESTPPLVMKRVGGRQLMLALREIPWCAWLWEVYRGSATPDAPFHVAEALEALLREAAAQYREEYHEDVNLTEWRALCQYARNLALVRGRLRPGLYELAMAAKGCVDDDFGAITLERAKRYPANEAEEAGELPPSDANDQPFRLDLNPELPPEEEPQVGGPHGSLELHAEFDGGMERVQHAYDFPELSEVIFSFRRRPRPTAALKAKWREDFLRRGGYGICSWPPEDAFIERFFQTIRARAMQQISDNHSTSEEFTSSALDGLDVRETMRNWHRKKLYVRRERIPPGRVGPVVLIWEDVDFSHEAPPVWRVTLYAENQNESDIAIYTTPPGREMVGPGITRVDYYGILSVYPAKRIADIWGMNHFALELFRTVQGNLTHARMLTAAALHFADERYIAVVAPHAPDAAMRQLARQLKKGIIYLPLATFSRAILKRARQSHVLNGHHVRGWAGDYIPKL
jgi:hypothetical protein